MEFKESATIVSNERISHIAIVLKQTIWTLKNEKKKWVEIYDCELQLAIVGIFTVSVTSGFLLLFDPLLRDSNVLSRIMKDLLKRQE